MLWELLFPLVPLFWTFAESNGDTDTDTDTDDDTDTADTDTDNGEEKTDDEEKTLAELKAELKKQSIELAKVRTEAKDRRLKLRALEKADADRKKSDMDELERVQTELQEVAGERDGLKTRVSKLMLDAAIVIQAVALGFADPNDAIGLVDMAGIEQDEETYEVTGVKEALEALAKEKAYLLKQDDDSDGPGTPTSKKKGGSPKKRPLPDKSLAPL